MNRLTAQVTPQVAGERVDAWISLTHGFLERAVEDRVEISVEGRLRRSRNCRIAGQTRLGAGNGFLDLGRRSTGDAKLMSTNPQARSKPVALACEHGDPSAAPAVPALGDFISLSTSVPHCAEPGATFRTRSRAHRNS